MRKRTLNKLIRDEKGQALMIVLILMLLGGLIIAPMLAYMGSGIKVGKEVYEERMELFYAADSGVEDGLWNIKHEQLDISLFGSDDPEYNKYAYYDPDSTDPYEWDYTLTEQVNDKDVDVILHNIWVPKDLAIPDVSDAKDIIEGIDGEPPKLVIAGSIPAASTYQIKITYNYDDDVDPDGEGLLVDAIGIWLPPGFGYVDEPEDSCSLKDESYYPTPDITDYCSGKAVVWDFADIPLVDFPGGTGESIERSFTFEFTTVQPDQLPSVALSWIDTTGMEDDDIDYAWDANSQVYKLVSTATDDSFDPAKETEVVAYTARSKMREMGLAMSGDYCAIGNTLMEATGSGSNAYYRDRLYNNSSATVQCDDPDDAGYVPLGATVDVAFLYWSGWIEGAEGEIIFPEYCDNFDNWIPGSRWTLSGVWDKEFQGRGSSGSEASKTLEMFISNNPPFHSLDLSPYSGQVVTVSWEQREQQTGWPWPELEPGDCLKFAFSGDGGSSWSEESEGYFVAFCDDNPSNSFSYTIPEEYVTSQFRMKFFLDFDETDEYCYIDDITISASSGSSVEDAKINRVIFNTNQITSNNYETEPTPDSGAPDSWCYACRYDATSMVKPLIEAMDDDSDTVTFTLGHWTEGDEYDLYGGGETDYPLATPAACTGMGCMKYQWTYAAWSLVIIYSSAETKDHQLYLFDDDFRYIAVRTTLDFNISGFLVPEPVEDEEIAAHMTCFVGDGDDHYSGDFMALNGTRLSDGISIGPVQTFWSRQWFSNPYENVWNSQSSGLPPGKTGIDIDDFYVEWDDDILEPGDTSATVSLGNASTNENDAELIMLIYVIVSFRSEITYGGTISYLVKG